MELEVFTNKYEELQKVKQIRESHITFINGKSF